MKKIIYLLIIVLSSFITQAQNKKFNSEKIRTFKLAFLTEKLNLTEVEAEKFWPIYNSYSKKMTELYKTERYNIKKRILKSGGVDNLSEKESKEIFDLIKSVAKNKSETKTNFYDKLVKILPYTKILTLEISEHEFNRKLMKKFRAERKKKKEKNKQ